MGGEQHLERRVTAMGHDKIVDTRRSEALAEIAYAGKRWLIGRLNLLIGFGE